MSPTDSDEEILALLRPELSRFVATLDAGQAEREGRIPVATLDRARHMGLFGLTIGGEWGGLGLGLGAACQVVATLAEHDRSLATCVGLHAGLGTRPLLEHGSEALQQRWLPAMASGEVIASFAATESGAGSDLMAVRTGVRREGASLRLSGEKAYVTNAAHAGLFTVLARERGTGPGRSHALLCVPADARGVEVGAEEHKLGLRASSTATVRFDDVELSPEHCLSASGDGMGQAHAALAWGRTLMSAGCLGLARAAFAASASHVSSRRQFGRALSGFPAVQAQFAQMASLLWSMEGLVEATARRQGEPETLHDLSLITKVFCSETAFQLCDRAIQLHGALGFMEDTGLPRLLRDCRITRIFEGANDVLLLLLGMRMLTSATASEPPPSTLRGEHERQVDAVQAELEQALQRARTRHGVKVIRQQTLVQRLARAHVDLTAARAALSRTRGDGLRDRCTAEHAAQLLCARAQHALSGLEQLPDQAQRDEALAALWLPDSAPAAIPATPLQASPA